jgi:hypothetical protein
MLEVQINGTNSYIFDAYLAHVCVKTNAAIILRLAAGVRFFVRADPNGRFPVGDALRTHSTSTEGI